MKAKSMKSVFLKFLVLFLVFPFFIKAQNKVSSDSLIFTEFYAKILGEKRRMIIHLPLNYFKTPEKKYPVFYVLDATAQDQHTSDKLAVLAGTGSLPEGIVVGILNGKGTRNRDQTPPFMRTETEDPKSEFGEGDRFLSFLTQEVIPKIDSNYRTNGHKTLTGHSRGGLFVLYAFMQKPTLFNAWFCYSTPVWRFEDQIITKMDEFLKHQKITKKIFLFTSAGAEETENIIGGYHRLNQVLKEHQSKNLILASYLTPFANHQQNPLFATSKALFEWGKFYSKN